MTQMSSEPQAMDTAPSEFDQTVEAIARSVMAVKEQDYKRALRDAKAQRAVERLRAKNRTTRPRERTANKYVVVVDPHNNR